MSKPLPTLKQHFIDQFYRPVEQKHPQKNKPDLFDMAKQLYEDYHGHTLPFGFRTFGRAMKNY